MQDVRCQCRRNVHHVTQQTVQPRRHCEDAFQRFNTLAAYWLSVTTAKNAVQDDLCLCTERKRVELLARTPLGRTGTVEEIAEAVRWLLDDAAYVTGQVLRLDGGRSLL